MEKELTLTPEDLATMINEAVEKEVAPLKEDVSFVRKNIHSETKDLDKLEGIDKCSKWLQALATGDKAVIKALSEGVGADGGFLVPTEFRAIVVEKLIKESVIRPLATVIPMGRDQLEIPTEGTAVTAVFTPENGAFTESNPNFGQIVLNTSKLTIPLWFV